MITAINRTFLRFDAGMQLVGYSRCQRIPLSLRQEAVQTARLIQQDAAGKPIAVMLSGGVDSEVVLLSFIEAGVPVEAWTFQFPDDKNSEEVSSAAQLAKLVGVKHSVLPIDIENFAATEARQIAARCRVPFIEAICQFKLFEELNQLGFFPVSGNAQVSLSRVGFNWYYCDSDFVIGAYRHGAQLDGVISFFQRTPELVLAQLQQPRYADIASGIDWLAGKVLLSTERTIKQKVYHDHWPETRIRPKRDGGENIRHLSTQFGRQVFGDREFQRLASLKHLVPYSEMLSRLVPSVA